MADTYIINASNQTVTGTAAGEIFEFDSTLTNGTFTNIVINAAGGKDTIKAGTQSATRQTIDAVVTGLNPSSWLDFGETYGDNFFYFATQPDGIHITNENGAYKFKLLGVKNTSICTGDTKNIFRALQQTTPWDNYRLGGTELADTLTVNHARCKATGRSGDDVITSYGNFSLLEGSEGNDIVINKGNNGTMRGDNDNDILICSGTNNVLQGGYGNDIVINTGNNCTLHGDAGDDILICGGTNNTLTGSDGNDTFEVYSYAAGGSNTTLTGGNGNNAYLLSTGLVGVDGAQVNEAAYNLSNTDTVNVTITDAKAGDSYYIRDLDIYGINMSTTSDGIVISSTSGRINITLKNCDWNAVKDNLITRDTAQGYIYTCSLERAVAETAARSIPPEGISVSGNYLSVSAEYFGNLIMSSANTTYKNDQIVTIDATKNIQRGMLLGGNSNANKIYAGRDGNVLWGGQDTLSDSLCGGNGADTFLIGKNDGSDAVFKAGNDDLIHLYDVTLDDIASFNYDTNTIALGLKSGNFVSLVNGEDLSPTFMLANRQCYRYNRTSNSWQNA